MMSPLTWTCTSATARRKKQLCWLSNLRPVEHGTIAAVGFAPPPPPPPPAPRPRQVRQSLSCKFHGLFFGLAWLAKASQGEAPELIWCSNPHSKRIFVAKDQLPMQTSFDSESRRQRIWSMKAGRRVRETLTTPFNGLILHIQSQSQSRRRDGRSD